MKQGISKWWLAASVIFFLLVTFDSKAQEKRKVKDVKGEWVVSDDITMPQAREKAVGQAKVEAMRQAGVPELISESTLSYRLDGPSGLTDLFESITGVDVFGEISEYRIVKEERKFNEVGNLVYTVWIDAGVLIHKEIRDPGFDFDVSGVQEKYGSPDKLTFELKVWKDSYLTAFVISENEGILLYPNKMEKKEMLKAGLPYRFPGNKGLEYEISTQEKSEINYLVLLLTKQDIPFLAEENPAGILRFVSGINPSQKAFKTYSFLIKKERD